MEVGGEDRQAELDARASARPQQLLQQLHALQDPTDPPAPALLPFASEGLQLLFKTALMAVLAADVQFRAWSPQEHSKASHQFKQSSFLNHVGSCAILGPGIYIRSGKD